MEPDETPADESAAAAGVLSVDEGEPGRPAQEATPPEAAPETRSEDGPGAETGESRAEEAAVEDSRSEPAGESQGQAPDGDRSDEATVADGEESEGVRALRQAQKGGTSVEGRVIGWNNGGFHVVVGELTGFCPRSEMEIGSPRSPKSYLDNTFSFHVLRIQKQGRRVVLSRSSWLKEEKARKRRELRGRLSMGDMVSGKIVSLTDFGAFVDLGGVQGLIHVSEISRDRVAHPSDVLEIGQEVEVKILKLEKSGRRISLSMRALEPDPWRDVVKRYPRGTTVKGNVEKATPRGAIIQLEPGLSGLLPVSAMSLPREASPARFYHPGKEVSVQVVSIDPRRHRITLAPEGSGAEGSRLDYQTYLKTQKTKSRGGTGFNALAKALEKIDRD